MKKIVLIVIPALFLAVPVLAAPSGLRPTIKEEVMEKIGSKPAVMKGLAVKTRAAIFEGTLSAKNGTTLTVTKDGKTYTVNTDSTTQLRRRFWGKATLDEMTVGDQVTVIGKWSDDAQATVQAKLVRDMSIQKRNGVFFGTVTTVAANGWVMSTINRGSQTVTVTSATKFTDRRGQVIPQSNIVEGQIVRVRGLWDNKSNTITEVTHVKDFSLPVKPTGAPSGTHIPTPTKAPTPTP